MNPASACSVANVASRSVILSTSTWLARLGQSETARCQRATLRLERSSWKPLAQARRWCREATVNCFQAQTESSKFLPLDDPRWAPQLHRFPWRRNAVQKACILETRACRNADASCCARNLCGSGDELMDNAVAAAHTASAQRPQDRMQRAALLNERRYALEDCRGNRVELRGVLKFGATAVSTVHDSWKSMLPEKAGIALPSNVSCGNSPRVRACRSPLDPASCRPGQMPQLPLRELVPAESVPAKPAGRVSGRSSCLNTTRPRSTSRFVVGEAAFAHHLPGARSQSLQPAGSCAAQLRVAQDAPRDRTVIDTFAVKSTPTVETPSRLDRSHVDAVKAGVQAIGVAGASALMFRCKSFSVVSAPASMVSGIWARSSSSVSRLGSTSHPSGPELSDAARLSSSFALRFLQPPSCLPLCFGSFTFYG